jgi:four helix bundle protein
MGYMYSFEKLDVWQAARLLVKDIYIISEKFPSSEKFGIVNQIRRASVSVVSNIAEGVNRFSLKEQSRFIEIAYGSLTEVYCQIIIASDLNFINDIEVETIKKNIHKISNQLNSLLKSIQQRLNKQINK